MAKRNSAEQTKGITPAAEELVNLTVEPPKANATAESATPLGTDGKPSILREPGDDSATVQSAETKSSWAPRTTIAVPLTDEAKRDHTKGEVARYTDGYNYGGIGARIDSPDKDFRPSEEVKAPLKEEHSHRDSMRWNKKDFHKKVIGQRADGSERNPVAERLDGEERFKEMVQRRRAENEKSDGGKTPI